MHNKNRNEVPSRPKDFKKSIMRLFKELNSYKVNNSCSCINNTDNILS